jgi:hypothetical protein
MKARWVKVDMLDNWAISVSADGPCQALPCMNSERWGGRSNHMYFPGYQVWTTLGCSPTVATV